MKKITKRILYAVGGTLAVALIAWTAWNASSAAQLEAAIDRAEDAGLPARFDEVPGYLDERYGPVPSNENAAPLLLAAMQSIEDLSFGDFESPLPDVTDELRVAVADAEPALALVAQALERPRCRYPADWEDGLAVRFPEISGAMQLSEALRAAAAVHLADDDPAGALEQARLLAGLARSLEERPTVIAQMVRIVQTRNALEVLRAALPRSEHPFQEWQSLAPASVAGAVVDGLRGELCFVSRGLAIAGGPEGFFGPDEQGPLGDLAARAAWPSERNAGVRLIDAYLDVIDHGGDPYADRIARCAAHDSRHAEDSLIVQALAVRLEPMVVNEAEALSMAMVTEAGARILAFRRLHGRWPVQLDEVPGVPTDPRTEEPLEMRVEGDDLVIAAPGGVGAWTLNAEE